MDGTLLRDRLSTRKQKNKRMIYYVKETVAVGEGFYFIIGHREMNIRRKIPNRR